ncbi:DUF3089 domain-containing protein [Qipengyuania sp. JC766]|uniref:DUF3089 domain-containing protein n=1 Tax=Qipengyuania sp. JC766 TaxID=3232139 RepID=UPI003459AAEC
MARKFLYFVFGCILLVILAAFAFNIWGEELLRDQLVPSREFTEQEALAPNAYQDPEMWYSRPGMGARDPARFDPPYAAREDETGAADRPPVPAPAIAEDVPGFAVFFVHPTSFIPDAIGADTEWNANFGDEITERRARLFTQGMASAFDPADEIWAPKYRQAVVGAFLTDQPEAQQAIDAAYRDVRQAFAFFLESVDPDKPIVLAGHSQGSLHLLQLLLDDVANSELADRIAAVYPIGWPISVERDLPSLPFPACATAEQPACISSWSSFADGGNADFLMDRFRMTPGFDGQPRGDSPILCTNPLTGRIGGAAPASANLGTLVPSADLTSGELVVGAVPARCGDSGMLFIGDPPEMGNAVLPGNNYHVYDIPLFWANLRQDVVRRVRAWEAAR